MRRIYRRICVLRQQGRSTEAADLESEEFSRVLSAARAASQAGEEEASVLAAEAERVSTACLLAEMVAPLLAECLKNELPALAGAKVASAAVVPRRSSPRPAPPSVPNIADMIDGMLSLEAAAPTGAR